MTLEELKNNLDTLIALYESIDSMTSDALGKKTLATMQASLEFIRRPALRKWTADDGTPPDGLYLTALDIDGTLVKISGSEAVYVEYVDYDLMRSETKTVTPGYVFGMFGQLYGPIEAEGKPAG
jgi:hypothetical protein